MDMLRRHVIPGACFAIGLWILPAISIAAFHFVGPGHYSYGAALYVGGMSLIDITVVAAIITFLCYRRANPLKQAEWAVIVPALAAAFLVCDQLFGAALASARVLWPEVLPTHVFLRPGGSALLCMLIVPSVAFLASGWMSRGEPEHKAEVRPTLVLWVCALGLLVFLEHAAYGPLERLLGVNQTGAEYSTAARESNVMHLLHYALNLILVLVALLCASLVVARAISRGEAWVGVACTSAWMVLVICGRQIGSSLRLLFPERHLLDLEWGAILALLAGILAITYAHCVVGRLIRRLGGEDIHRV
jgi:hypothetical protein